MKKRIFMYRTLSLTLLFATLLLTSCFKTAEEIKREQDVDQRLSQSSKTIADLNETIQNLKQQITSTSGQIEEIDYKSQKTYQETNKTFSETMIQLTEQVKNLVNENAEMKQQIASLQSDVNSQKKYIKNVTGSLSKIAGPSKSSSTSKLQDAHKAFEKNDKKQAKELYNEVLSEGKINNAQKNHVYFNLGLLNYWDKKYNDAITYFSKIYTKWPKSSFSPRALLYIARSFDKQKKGDEAKAMYQELINKYPTSTHAKTAKKEVK